jgi:VCBS repeat-containing protein
MSTVVAIVKSIVGQVIATSAEGAHRVLVEGDRLFVGDTLDTGAGGMVTLELTDGRTLDLGRGTQWSSADVGSETTEATAQSASDAKAEVLDVQRAIAAGADPTQDLAPTAAGPGAGGAGGPAGGSHSFVLLSETAGAVQPEIGIAFTDPAGGDAVVQEQAFGIEQNVAPTFTTPDGNDATPTINVTTDEDTAYNGTFTATDNNGDALTYAVVGSGTAHGSLTLTPQGVWTYTPAANYNGPDSFQVIVSDGRGGSDTLTVNIGVNPVNDAPIADPAAASATEDGAIVGGKLTASDVDTGDTQTFTVQAGSTAPAGFTLGSDGTWSLDPSNAAYQSLGAGETLTIDVPFTVTDSGGLTSNSVLTLTITGVNDAPDVSGTVEVTRTEDDSAFTVNLLSNASDVDNGDTISVTGVAQSGTGDASGVTVNADGTLSVNPNAYNYLAVGESVTLTYTYNVVDLNGGSTPTSATITINGVNDAPVVSAAVTATFTEDAAPQTINLLQNASDVDLSDSLSVANLQETSGGNASGVTLNSDGTLSVNPNAYNYLAAGQTLTLTYTYNVVDGNGGVTPTTATLTIDGVNDAPTVSGTVAVTQTEDDASFSVNLLSNASDVDGDTLSVSDVAQSGTGDASGVTVNADGTLSVNPNAYNYLAVGESVTLTYTYNVVDGNGGQIATSASITINGVNDAPVVSAAVTATFTEDAAPQTINLLQNASDVDLSDSLSIANLQETSGGNASGVTLNSDGTLSVNPNAYNYLAAGQTVTLNYTYNVVDGNGGVTPTTATLTITGQNDAPVAVADIASGNEDTLITGNVLTNDSDPDTGAVLSVSKYSFSVGPLTFTANAGETLNTVVGKLVIDAQGNFTFTPVANYNGPVPTVTYTLTDGTATTTATLNITVNPVNDAPFITAPTSVQVTNEDTSKVFSVLRGNSIATGDIDSPNLTTTLNVDHGTLTLGPLAGGVTVTGNGTGSLILSGSSAAVSAALQGLTYKPTADYNGTDLLKITSSDGSLTTNSSVAIRVDAVADIRADAVSVNEDNALSFNAITGVGGGSADNFENPDRAITAVTQGQHGSVTFNADGTLVYTPVANYNGTDTFTYTVTSGGVTETATVTVTVKPVNDAAVLSSADVHVAETNDAITTGGTLTVTDIDSPATFTPQNNVAGTYGTFSINAAGVWTFTANSAFNALNVGQSVSDSFTVTSADGTPTTVKVTIDGTNDAPVASSSVVGSGSEDPAAPIQVTLGGSDVDGTVTGYSIESLPEHGTLYANADGTGALTVGDVVTGPVYFVPTPNWGGSTDFDFKAIDNSGASSDTSSATINVAPVADAPTLTFGGGSQVIATGFEETNLASGWNGNIAVGSLGNGNWQTGNNGNGVEIGSEGTYITGGSGTNQVIELERNDGDASNLFTTISADAGETFVVQFQYSPRSGQESNSGIDVFWGGVKVGTLTGSTAGLTTYTYTLPADAAGNYTLEFRATDSNSLGGLLDNISVVSQPNVGLEDHAIKLSSISAAVTDTDGSEHISKITIDDAPAGSIISDGHGNTVTSDGSPIDITNWAKDSLTFTPPQDANGTVVMHVSATSTESNGDTATTTLPLTVTVLPDNDAPTTTNQTLTTAEDTPVTGVVTGADVDGDTLSYGVVGTGAAHGVVTLDPVTGAFTYTPGSDYNGPDSFQVAISDGKGGTVISTISIGVTPVPDAPTVTITTDANNDGTLTTNEVNGSSTVAVTIGLPADAVVGNTLTVSNGAGAPQIFVLTPEQIAAGSIATTFPTPADGATLTVSASISDGTLTSPTASDSATIGDTTATAAPTVTITTDGNNDGTLSNVELGTATTVAVHIGIPADAVAGNTLKIVSNTGSIQIITLTDTLIASGIDLNYLRPADGATLSVTATITDAAGNVSQPGNDSAVVGDTTATAAPTVVITTDTNNDGTLSNTELGASANVTVKITVPAGTVVGDVLNITNPDGSVSAHPIVSSDLSNGVELTYPRPADGQPISVSATITDAAGNISTPGNDSAVVGDTTASPAPIVTITTDSNNDGIISTAELKATQSVVTHFAIPAGAAIGDTLKISIDGHPTFVLTIDQYLLDHGVNMYTQGLADGQALTVSATITDAAGNVSAPGSDTATLGDTTATAAPTVVISTDTNNDGTLSNTELGASTSVTVKITVPTGTVVGDTLNITNPDGSVTPHAVVAADLTDGVTLTYARPADGASLTVSATITDAAGNTSTPGSDSATVGDTTATAAPTVVISTDTNNDGTLSNTELGASTSVTVKITVPTGTVVGDTLNITNPDGSVTPHAVVAADLTDGVTLTYARPADGASLTVSATITDAAGNTSVPGSDSATVGDTTATAAPTVVISTDTNNDSVLSNTELGASTSVTVKVSVPTGTVVGETLNITNPDGSVTPHAVVAADLTDGVTLTYARPADGSSISVTATLTDAAGNTSLPGSDSATVGDTTAANAPVVTIVDDANNNAQLTSAEVGADGVQISVAVNNADLVAGGTVSLNITNGSDTHTANLALSNGVLVTAGTTTPATGFSYSNGTITFTETKPATGETISATATQTDAAGNTSAPGTDSAQMVNTNPVAVADHYVLGLTGQYFGYAQGNGANLENIAQVETLISGKTPDATFVATSLNYGSVGGDLGAGTHLQTFLGNDAASLSTDPGNTSDAIIKLSGQVSLDAGTYSFKVTSDDGFILRIDGQDVVKFDGNRSAASTTASYTVATSGAHQIEIIYWDQGSDASLKVEVKGASDSAYTVLGATGNTSALVTSEDNALTLNASTLLKNDSDVDGDALTVTSVQSATHGNVALNNGVITFTPDANYNGEATFQYTVSDGHGGTSSATVTLYVTPVNDAPVVTSGPAAATGTVIEAGNLDSGAVVAGTPTVTGTLTATDVDQGSTTTWSLNTGTGTYGTIAITAAGVWTYTLNNSAAATNALAEGQTGHETFTATVSDGQGGTATQVITVNVTGTNDAPTVSAPLTASGTEDGSNVVVNLLAGAADVDSGAVLSVSNVSTLPAGVSLSGNTLTVNPKDASFQSLAAGATKDIVVTYNVTDEKGAVVAQTATVTITGTNDAPTVSGVVTASGVEDGASFTVNMLTNASDVDTGAVLSVGSVSALPAGVTRVGSVLTVDPSNAAFQALKAGEQQTLNITYNVVDDKGATVAQTATITITGTNDAPVVTSSAAAATGTVIEAGLTPAGVATAGTATIGGTLTATDVDHNSSTTWTAAGTGTYGSLSMTTGGVWTYTLDNTKPATQALAAGETTTDTFTATVSDGLGGTATQVITVTVKGTNDAPVVTSAASAATGAVTEAGLLPNGTATAGTASATGTVVATDADHSSTTTWSVANGTGTYGSLSMTSAGVWTYNLDNSKSATQALAAGDVKTETFTATVSDGLGGTATQVINVTVNGTNDAPVAVNDHYILQGLTGQYFGYAQGSGANLATISQVETLITGKTPDATFTATTLNYGNGVTTDLGAGTNLQTFLGTDKASLSTDPGTTSDAIIKLSGQVSLNAGTYSFKVTSDDGFILRIDGQDVVKFDGNRGAAATTATYTIPTSGAHQIEIIYWDQGGSAVLKVETKLASAADSAYTVLGTSGNTSSLVTAEDTALAIKTSLLLGNDSDADGGTLSVTSVQGATHGDVVLSNGVITFTPSANYNGEATFQYTVSDGKGGTATANVTLFVTAVNDAPVVTATPVALTGNEDQTGGIIITSAQLLGNASDVDGNTLSVLNLTKTSGSGTLAANPDGTWTFTPTKDWNGEVKFTYNVSDGTVGVADSAVLTVKPVADIVADTATTDEDTAITLNVLGNDNFSNTATISAINGVNITTNSVNVDHGSVKLVNGELVFTPAADYHGPSTFTYTVTSGGVTETSTVNLTINSVSDASIPTVTVTPKGYWTFDSTAVTGNGNNAVTTVSNATTSQTGVLNDINTTGGSAIPTLSSGTGTGTRADGAGKYLTLNTGTDIGDVVQVDSTITNALLASATLTFWINTAQAGNSDGKGTSWNNPSIIGSEQVGGGNDIQWGAINSSGKIGFGLGNVDGVYSTTSINDSQWHNIAISRDASSGLVSVYVDGKLEATGSPTDSAFTGALNQLLEIGATNAFTGSGTDATDTSYYKGALDDLRIYSGVLTADQVAAVNHVENGYQGTAIANATTAAQNTLTFSVTDTASKLTVTGLENGMTLTDGHGHTFTSTGVDSIGDLSSWDTSNLSLGNTGTNSGTLIFAGSNSVTMADGSIDTSTTYQAITLANGTSVLATGGTGADTLNGSSAADLLRGGDGNDTLYGGAGNDRLEGGAGNDKLYGGAGNDLLIGGGGDDLLFGGSGNNIMTGGAGADTFAWAKGESGNSTITDFKVSDGDRIDLTDLLPDMTNVNVLDYIKVDTATSTIQVSTSGHIDQGSNVSITLQGVDLTNYGSSSADIIKSLVAGTDPVVKTEHH